MSLIQINHLTFGYDGSCDLVFDDVSFQIDTDWKLGFVGRNGRGKTTFLKLLLGQYPYQGTIAASEQFDYFPFEVVHPQRWTQEVVEELCPEICLWQIQKELAKLSLEEEILYRPFATLSQGEQAKIQLAALFLREGHFLLIDEPTNHLDLEGRGLVSRYLDGKKGYILVSHDRAFLDGCVDHILSLNRGGIQVQKGNYSSWEYNRLLQESFERGEHERLKKDIARLQSAMQRTKKWSHQEEASKF